jgi:hypothetical protein
MSWQATAWAELQTTGSPSRKVLLLILANYADEFGICWPSQETLSKGTEQSLDTIQRQLRRLEDSGLISIAVRPQGRGRWPSRTYRLNMPAPEITEPQTAARSDESGTEPQPARDHAATSTDHRAATSPVTEPQALRHEPSIELSSRTFTEPSSAAATKRKPTAVERQQAFQRNRQGVEVIQNRIANRLDPDGWLILQSLSPGELATLTKLEEAKRLSGDKIESLKRLWNAIKISRGAA